jgi:hypothetical protein
MRVKSIFPLLAVLAILTTAVFPSSAAQAQDDPLKGCVPKITSPIGTILDNTPTYKWKLVLNATAYQFQVKKGTALIYEETLDSTACSVDGCEVTPALTLTRAVYKWHVHAFVDGVWKAYSKFTYFTVSPPEFKHGFNGSMGTFASKGGGTWSIDSGMYLHTEGLAQKWTSAYSTRGRYTDFDYSVKTRRLGDGTVFIAARMGNLTKTESFEWYPGYRFGYCDSGEFAVFRINADGSKTIIQPWTFSAVINPQGWNVLRVVAQGSEFSYYINGNLMLTFTDATFKRGFVGVTARRETTAPGYVWDVDWARLTVLETPQ